MAIKQSEIEKLEELYTSALRLYELKEVRMALIGIKQILENIGLCICEQEGETVIGKVSAELLSKSTFIIRDKYPSLEKKASTDGIWGLISNFHSYGYRASQGDIVEVNFEEIQKIEKVLSWFKDYVDFIARPNSKEVYINENAEALTHCLRYIHIHNYQCIKELKINDIPLDAQFVVFTGENGFGKTAILQAIAIGLNGNVSENEILCKNSDTRIKVEIKTKEVYLFFPKKEEKTQIVVNEFLGYGNRNSDNMIGLRYLAAYGASRLQLESKESTQKEFSRNSPVYNLFHNDGILRNIEYNIEEYNRRFLSRGRGKLLEFNEERIPNSFFKDVISILKKVLPHVENIESSKNETYNSFGFSEKKLIFHENGQKIITNNLSAGNKSIFGMIGDIILRLKEANSNENISDYEGIVLIDELEAHLHPKWQREFPRLLAEIFPKVQFIVTTHSAITFLGMPSNSVFYNVTSHPEKGTQAERIDIDIENLLPNQILTSPIFGMENIKHVHNQNGDKVRTEDNYAETLKREEVRNALKEAAKNFSFSPLKD